MKTKKYFFLILFIFYGIQSYCQNPSDSVKMFTMERKYISKGYAYTRTRTFSRYEKVNVVLNDGSKFNGLISDVTDISFSVGTKKDIKIGDVKGISKYGSSILAIVGGSLILVGIPLSFYRANGGSYYYYSGMLIADLGIVLGIIGIKMKNKSNYSVKKGWKIKIEKEVRPIYDK